MNGLTLRGLIPGPTAIWAIESPTPGIVLINVVIPGSRSPAPLHWRAGDWTTPPVDVEINPNDGAIEAIQIVLQDERIDFGGRRKTLELVSGQPCVDVSDWPADRYRDVHCSVAVERAQDGELVVDFGDAAPMTQSGESGSLVFGWDASGELSQLIVGPFSSEDWDDINAFSVDLGGDE